MAAKSLSYQNSIQEILKSKTNLVLTDGAARGNPGPAGWAFILLSGECNLAVEKNGRSERDTNNRMEMMGALEAFEEIKKRSLKNSVTVLTDSNFLVDAIQKWRHGWKRNDWIKSDGNTVLYIDIWKKIDQLCDELRPILVHVDAHKGHPGNTRCDLLAVSAAMEETEKLYSGKLEEYPHFTKITYDDAYTGPRYLCWKGKTHKVLETWPGAQEFMKKNPGYKVKKIHSPEEIENILQMTK
jgi:ribonuclease HI